METITITKRVVNGKNIYHKKFDEYDKGFYGLRISKKEYEESKFNNKIMFADTNPILDVIERITYYN